MFMKRNLTFSIAGLIAFSILLIQFACKHEIPVPSCESLNFQVAVTQTPATLNQNNGTITATASGGSGFEFSLNGGPYQDSGYFSGLQPFRNYNVVGKNSAGCTDTVIVQIDSYDPCQGVNINVTLTKTDASPNQSNGSVTATATGGTGFTYSINGGAFQNSGTFNNLAAGTYTVAAKSSAGCIGTNQITVGTNNPCAGINVVVSTTVVQPTTGQSNGSITASATGGTGFTYSINNGALQASGTFSNLAAGTYTVTAKNSNGCLGSKQVILTATSPCNNVAIVITTAVTNTTPCVSPTNNGSITVTASGSTGFTYNINGGAYQASNVFSNLNAGNYVMGVKDANGCTKTQTVTVGVIASGPLFAQVKNLILTRCNGNGCHIGSGNNAAGYNFDSDCNIVSKWSQINHTSVLYTSGWTKMPKNPQPLFTAAEKTIFTNWVNAGHRYSD